MVKKHKFPDFFQTPSPAYLLSFASLFTPFPKRNSFVWLNVWAAANEYAGGKLANVNGHADNY